MDNFIAPAFQRFWQWKIDYDKIDVIFFLCLHRSTGHSTVEYTDCISEEGLDRPPNECPESDGEAPVMLELWGMQSIVIVPRSNLVAPDSILYMGQIELSDIQTERKNYLFLIE